VAHGKIIDRVLPRINYATRLLLQFSSLWSMTWHDLIIVFRLTASKTRYLLILSEPENHLRYQLFNSPDTSASVSVNQKGEFYCGETNQRFFIIKDWFLQFG